MNEPTSFDPIRINQDTMSINAYFPLPGYGVLPINAFLIRARQPVLVDTGLAALGDQFQAQLYDMIDPVDLRWIWITHMDPDHLGNLREILDAAPNARVVTTYLGMGKMAVHGLPLERVYLLNPGQSLNVGDRKLLAVAPPTFDAPETCGLFDSKHHTLISADSCGAIMQEPAQAAQDINREELRDGCLTWATIDAPWLHHINPTLFNRTLQSISKLGVETLVSSHLPPAYDMTSELFGYLREAIDAPRFTGPDQAALESMMAA